MIPDWQLPAGVDRGLWDYLHAADMVAGYDEMMRASALARADVTFCARAFPSPGRLLDIGCGTGRLCAYFAPKGYECVGVDLSDEMLAQARANGPGATFVKANIAEPLPVPDGSFDYGACLFSTLGMVRGAEHRTRVLLNAFRALRPGATFVLHAHNRYYRGLGRKRVWGQWLKSLLAPARAGEITMPQAYGGAPLTLYHYTRRIAERLLDSCGFRVQEVLALGADGEPARGSRAYGWLVRSTRP
ncbi:MAG: class I SAM-dependent methyltransferase [Planctomycetes bacterium]|nr:class I SAM-dependent methyltransferase [Planctomycetota bacterium]